MQVGTTIENAQGLNQGPANVAVNDGTSAEQARAANNELKKISAQNQGVRDELTKKSQELNRNNNYQDLSKTDEMLYGAMLAILAEILGKWVEKDKEKLTDVLNDELKKNEFLTKELNTQKLLEELKNTDNLSDEVKNKMGKSLDNKDMIGTLRANVSEVLDKVKDSIINKGKSLDIAVAEATDENRISAANMLEGMSNKDLLKETSKATDSLKDEAKDALKDTAKDVVKMTMRA